MTHQSPTTYSLSPIDAGRQVAHLRNALELIGELAGRSPAGGADESALDESARISSAYEQAHPVVQRRFDAFAAETAAWAAAGIGALLESGEERSAAAAERLAEELEEALSRLESLVRRATP